MSDDENEESNVACKSKTKNRASRDVTELKTIIVILAWNECSKSATTDSKGLDDLLYQKILTWLIVFPNDYGNIFLQYINNYSVGTNKLKSEKVMVDLAPAFPVLPLITKAGPNAYVRFAKKSFADITKYLSPYLLTRILHC